MKIWLFACAAICTLLMACQRDVDGTIPITSSDSLFITSFTPDSAHIGDQVTIRGKGFASISGIGNVQVGSVKAQIVSTSDTLLIIKILPGTPSGKISVLIGNDSVTSTRTFTILSDSLQILSFSPDTGRIGSQITIKGNNFAPSPVGTTVKINTSLAELVSGTDSTLIIKVLPGTTSGKISVVVGNESDTSTQVFTVLPDSLKILSFSPDTGSIGSQITIAGKNFPPTPGANIVKINNTNAEVLGGTDSTLIIKVSPGTTSGRISVTYGAQTAISVANFTVTSPPAAIKFEKVSSTLGSSSNIFFLNAAKGFVATLRGVFKSLDSGKTWENTINRYAESVTFYNDQMGYYIGGANYGFTKDGGITWTNKTLPFEGGQLNFVSPGIGFATGRGLFKTVDTGNTWVQIQSFATQGARFESEQVGWLLTSKGLEKTIDGGKNFVTQVAFKGFTSYTIQFPDNQNGWANVRDTFALKTSDRGNNWEKIRTGDKSWEIHFVNKDVGFIATGDGLSKTSDGGKSWNKIFRIDTSRFKDNLLEVFAIDESHGWFGASDGSLYRWSQ